MVRVLIPLAAGCEELEAVTIIDILRRAGFEVVTAALDDRVVIASRKTALVADSDLATELNNNFDLVVLPGGLPGANYLAEDDRVIQILRDTVNHGGFVAAICAAPKVLAKAGLLAGRRATAYPGVLDDNGAQVGCVTDAAVEIDGPVITSRGPGTAIDFALVLVDLLAGKSLRNQVESALCRT